MLCGCWATIIWMHSTGTHVSFCNSLATYTESINEKIVLLFKQLMHMCTREFTTMEMNWSSEATCGGGWFRNDLCAACHFSLSSYHPSLCYPSDIFVRACSDCSRTKKCTLLCWSLMCGLCCRYGQSFWQEKVLIMFLFSHGNDALEAYHIVRLLSFVWTFLCFFLIGLSD